MEAWTSVSEFQDASWDLQSLSKGVKFGSVGGPSIFRFIALSSVCNLR